MGFIVIEGLDGSGKSTQIQFIEEYFRRENIKTRFVHFPRTHSVVWGDLISRFLRGELGKIDTVNPYLVALIYAGDRKDFASEIMQWMKEGNIVIADRYLYSNIAFQCAKISNKDEKEKLAKWIKYLEYEYNRIPVPDLNLYLNVPFGFTRLSLTKQRTGDDRNYLNGSTDIHEADLEFQQKVKDTYLWQVEENEDFEMIDCAGNEGEMLSPYEISQKVMDKVMHKVIKKIS